MESGSLDQDTNQNGKLDKDPPPQVKTSRIRQLSFNHKSGEVPRGGKTKAVL